MTERSIGAPSVVPVRPVASASRAHLPVLDGVRAVSIALVLAGHLLPLGPKSLALNGTVAELGMALFFCLSGFLIVSFLEAKPDVLEFSVRRIFRIVPGLALFLVIAIAAGVGVSLRSALIDLSFTANYNYDGLVEGVTSHLWSLSVEMQFYMAIAMIVLAFGRRGLWLVLIAAPIVTALRIQAGAYVNINTHLRVDEILSGGILALFIHRQSPSFSLSLRPSLATAGIAALGVLWLLSARDSAGPIAYARPYLTAALVGALLIGPFPGLQMLLSHWVLRYVANISYALYLYHPLMSSGPLGGYGTVTTYLVKRPITVLLTWGAAHVSTYYWERPFSDFARGRLMKLLRRRGPINSSEH